MREKICAIYQIRNILNKKIYIGSTEDIKRRFTLHLCELRNGKHHSNYLQNAWNKYGEDSFKFEILEYVLNAEDLIIKEQEYIDNKRPQYNMCKVAGSPLGFKHTEESKRKMSEARKGIVFTEETKRRMSESSKGFVFTDEHREKLSKARKSRRWSQEVKDKLSIANKGKKNRSKFTQEDINNIRSLIAMGEKLKDIAVKYGVSRTTINAIKLGNSWRKEAI